ncbi:macrophage mannose receptor 1b [Gadus morhua]|uniref:Mannose receptor, C type 1b n=1 Tax=Gadus morhua TaxID=8049 RepID=A0A8C5AJY3_GADMO|nr:macrophage mannose receptor 1-like [Gadus morhua]
MRIAAVAFVFFIQTFPCLASDDSPFILVGKSSDDCVVSRGRDCSQIRWTSANRLMVTGQKKCLGAQGMSVGSSISQYDCDDRSNLQKWVCRNGTLLALKDSKYYMMLKPDKSLVLSSNIGPNNEFVIRGTGAGACLKTHREHYTIEGNAFGKICMFPFQYKDRWFDECTKFDSSISRPWCSVLTKSENEHWGYCPSTATKYWQANIVSGAYYQINMQSALTWDQAFASCKQQGSSLLSITEPSEQGIITVMLGKGQNRLWMGLTMDQEHGWQWVDGKPFRYLRWDSGHPIQNPGYNCAIMDSGVQYFWQTMSCSKKLGYICHKAATLPIQAEVEAGFCPSPWIPYNGHCFYLNRTKKTWPAAQTECGKSGGSLASIGNIEDKSFVISQLGYVVTDELWIGLNDRKMEGLFDWIDHNTVLFTSWEKGSPKSSGANEDCVLLRGENGNWADRSCTEKHGYVCMKISGSESSGDEVPMDLGCKPGWRRHGSYCYLVGSETKTFDEAKEACKSGDSYMADVANGVDNAFLVSILGLRSEKYFWLGLSNQGNIDDFVWINSNNVKFTHWNANMPAHLQGCVAMNTGVYAGLWDVLPCTNKEKYVCKHLAEGAVLTAAPPTLATPKCAENWKPVGTRQMCAKFFTGPRSGEKTWFEARDYCRAIGGDLLSIHNQLEMKTGSHGKAWIGLSEPTPGSGYQWSDGTPLNFLHWMSEEPNNQNSAESCVEFRMYYWDEEGSWNDVHCETYNDWMCQIRAGLTPKPPPNDTTTGYIKHEDGWLEWGTSQYYINDRVMAMEDARSHCKKGHGDLVVINSEAENIFLWKMIARSYGSYYIGMLVDFDQTFGWMDGSSTMYQRWDENQPDFRNNDENCVMMSHHSGFWHDINCGHEHKSICKRSTSVTINSTAAPTEAPKGGCPLDWSIFQSKCYRIVNSRKDKWAEARRRCNSMGGNLASIVSRSDQAFLLTRMSETGSGDLWIGLNSLEKGEFFWTDGRPRRYTNWGFNKYKRPGSFYSSWSDEGCVVLSGNQSTYGRWIGHNCNETFGYVCQRNVDSQFQSPTGPLTPITYVKMANDSVKIITQNLTWSEAKARCQQDGAYLASIRNEWTRAYIELQAINLNSSLWIGLNKGETGGYFRFISGWHLTMANWSPGEPTENSCVYLDVDGMWKTGLCNMTMKSACLQSSDVAPTDSTEYVGSCPIATQDERSERKFAWMPFKAHCYVFITETVEWANAASDCSRHGGILASIEDPEEQTFIQDQVSILADGQSSFWIGLYKTHAGKWNWLDKTIVDYTNWDEDSPDESNSYAKVQSLTGKWTTGRKWNDRAYICKTPKVALVNMMPTAASHTIQSKQRAHTSLVVVVIVFFLAGIAALAIFIFKKSGRSFPKPAFENPLYFNRECPKPDVVDTNQLIENAEKDEEDQAPIITL